jgi:hypothetical protein
MRDRRAKSIMNCWRCATAIDTTERVGFRDECPSCENPLHVCHNCRHYDPSYNNQCREPMAERVVDKDRANFCEYFAPATAARRAGAAASPSEARAKLDSMFRKKA